MKPGFLCLLLTLLSCLSLTPAQADGPTQPVPEYTMKAIYLYNFAQLTEWPSKNEAADTPFTICIYGQNELVTALVALRGKTVNQQQLRFLHGADVAEARQCHLLYIGEDETERGSRLIATLRGAPVLTVTDAPQLAQAGAMLLIVSEGRRLSFEANVDFAKRSQLKFSSKLLALARRVSGG